MSDKPKLLMVDDEPDMLDFLQRVLRRRFAVDRASSAADALQLLAAGDYEVLITDQKMPNMSGLDLLADIRDKYPDLVRVLLSGFTDVQAVRLAVERCGIHNYILKPVDSQKLLEAIDKAYRVRDGEAFEATE